MKYIQAIATLFLVFGGCFQIRYGYRLYREKLETRYNYTVARFGPFRFKSGLAGIFVMMSAVVWPIAATAVLIHLSAGEPAMRRTPPDPVRNAEPVKTDQDTSTSPQEAIPDAFLMAIEAGDTDRVSELLTSHSLELMNVSDAAGLTPVHIAAREGHQDVVELLLKQGAVYNMRNILGATPASVTIKHDLRSTRELIRQSEAFYAAVEAGDIEKIRRLLKTPPKNRSAGPTPLHMAAAGGHKGIVRILLRHGLGRDQVDEAGATPLHHAVRNGHADVVKLFLKFPDLVNTPDSSGATCVHLAAAAGHTSVLDLLLRYGDIDVNTRRNDQSTALHLAAAEGHESAVKLLIHEGADLNARDATGNTPLHGAAQRGHKAVTEQLVGGGAFFDATNVDGETPLSLALDAGHAEIKRHLQSVGDFSEAAAAGHAEKISNVLLAGFSFVDARDSSSLTPIHRAVDNAHIDVVALLLKHGANPNVTDQSGLTPLHYSARAGADDIARLLLSAEAAVAAVDAAGTTALHFAAISGSVATVRLLLEHDAAPDPRDSVGISPMHVAVEHGNADILDMLVSHGARIGSTDNKGETLMHRAARGGHSALVERMIRAGLDVNARDKFGNTPLHMAAWFGHEDAADLLLKKSAIYDARNSISGSIARDEHYNPMDAVGSTPESLAEKRSMTGVVALIQKVKAFHDTIRMGDNTAMVEQLRDARPLLINSRNDDGLTPLHIAISEGNEETMRLLLSNGAHYNVKNTIGASPGRQAAWFGRKDLLAVLDIIDGFFKALHRGDRDVVSQLIADHGALVLNARDALSQTPVHVAAARGDLELLRLLVQRGAEFDPHTILAPSPLESATERGHARAAGLLQRLVKFHEAVTANDIAGIEGLLGDADDALLLANSIASAGRYPIHTAAASGSLPVLNALIAAGCDLNAVDPDGATALYLAAKNGRVDAVERLLGIAGIDVMHGDKKGSTAMHAAARKGNVDVLRLLVSTDDSRLHVTDDQRNTPLHVAAEQGHIKAIEFLLGHGAAYNQPNALGVTPMYRAKRAGHTVLTTFLEAVEGVFSAAATGDRTKMSAILEARGSAIGKIRNARLETPLHVAAGAGHLEVVTFLVASGAPTDSTDLDGHDPATVAREKGHDNIASYLDSAGK